MSGQRRQGFEGRRYGVSLRSNGLLGIDVEQKLCAKSTLQLFRAKLELNERFQKVFGSSIAAGRRVALLKKKRLEVALDVQPSGDVLNVYVAASRGGVPVV